MTSKQERELWDVKATAENVAYEIWNEDDSLKWQDAADLCAGYFRVELSRVWYSGANFLDIGCGIGRLTHRLSVLPNAPNFIGVDISSEMLNIASKDRHFNEVFQLCDGRTLRPILDSAVEGIYSMVTFQHIPNSAFKGYLVEMARVLKLGGGFCFQYVEGNEQGLLSHNTCESDVLSWLAEIGLPVTQVCRGFMFDNWTWITGKKGAI